MIEVKLRLQLKEKLTPENPILVHMNGKGVDSMTGDYMWKKDKIYAQILG